jgi:hypothetical protein
LESGKIERKIDSATGSNSDTTRNSTYKKRRKQVEQLEVKEKEDSNTNKEINEKGTCPG